MLEERPLECREEKMDWYRTADRFFNKNGFGTTMLKILEEARQELTPEQLLLARPEQFIIRATPQQIQEAKESTKDMSSCQVFSKEDQALGH